MTESDSCPEARLSAQGAPSPNTSGPDQRVAPSRVVEIPRAQLPGTFTGATLSRIAPSRRPAKAIARYVKRLLLIDDASTIPAAVSDSGAADEALFATAVVVAMGVVELVQAASINVMATAAIAPSLRTTGMMPPSVVTQCSRNGTSNDRLPGELAQVTRAGTKFLYPIAELGNATACEDNHVVVGARDREPEPEGNEEPILELPAFERAFEKNFAAIHRYIARRVGVPLADDLAAETFATAFRRRASFESSRGSLRSWLYGIATNLLRNHWRAEQHLLDLDSRLRAETELREDPSLSDERLSASFVAPRIAAALRTLVGEQREILLLHAWAELSHEEIAVALDIPPGTVRSRLSRACAALREELHGFDFDLWEFEGADIPAVSEGNEHD